MKIKCTICKKIFDVSPSRKEAKYCSRECYRKSQIGKPSWNKGIKTGIVPKTAFKKGFQGGHKFEKGHKPWNTGIKRYPNPVKHPSWKGGEIVDRFGYVSVHCPNHPFAKSNKYVLQHRLVMEKHLKRFLAKEEVVHHIDENKSNNDINNLMLFPTNSAHARFHAKQRKLT